MAKYEDIKLKIFIEPISTKQVAFEGYDEKVGDKKQELSLQIK